MASEIDRIIAYRDKYGCTILEAARAIRSISEPIESVSVTIPTPSPSGMKKVTIVIHYRDDVEIDPVLIEDFVRDHYPILNFDACIDNAKEDELSTLVQREI